MRIIVFVMGLILFGAGFYLCYRDKTGAATATYAAGVLCLIFAFLPEFKRFKGFGVEAELLERKIVEADETIARLRNLSKPLAELMFTIVARSGRWDSMVPRHDRYRIMEQLESELCQIGMSKTDIENAKRDWHRFNLFDLSSPVFEEILERIKEKKKEEQNRIGSVKQPISPNDQDYKKAIERLRHIHEEEKKLKDAHIYENIESVYDGLINFVQSTDVFTEDEKQEILTTKKEELEDLQYYSKNKKFRRLDHWFKSE